MSTEEKFVTIPFKVWEEKYKPMEAENHRLQSEIDNKQINVSLWVSSMHIQGRKSIGFIYLKSDGGYGINIKAPHDLRDSIEKELQRQSVDWYNSYFSKEEAYQLYDRISASVSTWEKLSAENEKRIVGIPWIIRKIFGIKP